MESPLLLLASLYLTLSALESSTTNSSVRDSLALAAVLVFIVSLKCGRPIIMLFIQCVHKGMLHF